jgi:hypothetical protein
MLFFGAPISGCCGAYLFFIAAVAAVAAVIATIFLICGGVLLHFATSSGGILQDQLHVDSVSTHSLRLLPPILSLALDATNYVASHLHEVKETPPSVASACVG